MSAILFIARSATARELLRASLSELGHSSIHAESVANAVEILAREAVDAVVYDDESERGDTPGAELLDRLRASCLNIPVIVLASQAARERTDRTYAGLALSVLSKPVPADTLRVAIEAAVDLAHLRSANSGVRRGAKGDDAILGSSPALIGVLATITAVAPTLASVLIEGEPGTGKRLLARAIHERGHRSHGPFVSVDCASVPAALAESMIFGHERGAFPGAQNRYRGALERATLGTVVFVEVSELAPELQAKLERALHEMAFVPVGGDRLMRMEVRIVATTRRDLLAEVEAGRFRRDLYHRLATVVVRAPALHERLEDLPLLVDHFVRKAAARLGIVPPFVADDTIEALRARPWPGNIRELMETLERAVVMRGRGQLLPSMLDSGAASRAGPAGTDRPPPAAGPASASDEVLELTQLERKAIERALQVTGGNRTRAAKLLGITARTLRNKLRDTGRSTRTG